MIDYIFLYTSCFVFTGICVAFVYKVLTNNRFQVYARLLHIGDEQIGKKYSRTSLKYCGIPMEKALDQHGCDIVRDFFGKVLKAATLAAENNIHMDGQAISNLMTMYRNRVI